MERLSRIVTKFEETVIALLMAGMVLLTFSQVIARYVFNTGWGAALEATTLMYAWMILFGMSYGVKIGAHLGVDAIVALLPKRLFRIVAVFGALTGVLYALMLLDGSITYLSKLHKFSLGMQDLRFPDWFANGVAPAIGWEIFDNEVPRWFAFSILPIGLVLFAFRCLQAAWQIITGDRRMMIASHEAEDLVAENKDAV
ncbi:TRAP transporter small permease [Cohaesibacter celericrescens]|uniref:TRAP transporter small permease protein n=1 Tax=Cohaesibacter celericrescens TaxID=2067669 RepID=A0A2N5XLD3_9HYPH|nr:TRAP transporter small permease [Cohaesibacter celericrescens]PLW75302.1 TRAP transporter small permease [Cohaesibacter celericrescens]